MTEVLLSNGGTITNLEDPSCSHVVSIITLHYYTISEYSQFILEIPLRDIIIFILSSVAIIQTYLNKVRKFSI